MNWPTLQSKLAKKSRQQILALAKLSGVPPSTLYKLAMGYQGNPKAATVDKLRKVFK